MAHSTSFDVSLKELSDLTKRLDAHAGKFSSTVGAASSTIEGIQKSLDAAKSGKFTVAVVGQMNCGKSTLVNAIIGKRALPMAATVCTAKLSEVSCGQPELATIQYLTSEDWAQLQGRSARWRARPPSSGEPKDGSEVEDKAAAEIITLAEQKLGGSVDQYLGRPPKELALADLPEYAAKDGKFSAVTSRVKLQGPFAFDERIVWYDTPGLFDPVRARELETQRCLAEAAVVVLVLYAGAAFGKEDVEFLRRRLVTVGFEKIVVAINKMDVNNSEEDRVNVHGYVRQRLADLVAELRRERVPEALLKALDGSTPVPVIGLMGLYGRTRGAVPDAEFYEGRWAQSGLHFQTYDEALALSNVPKLEAEIHQMVLARDGFKRLADPTRKIQAFLDGRVLQLQTLARENDVARSDLRKDRRTIDSELNALTALAERLPTFMVRLRKNIGALGTNFERDVGAATNAVIKRVGDNALISANAAATSGVRRVWEDLGYETQEVTTAAHEAARRELPKLRDGVIEAVVRHVKKLAEDGKVKTDEYYFDSLKWLTNASLPAFEAGTVSEITDDRAWYEQWTPFGRNQAELAREKIPGAVKEWAVARRNTIQSWAASVIRAVDDQYLTPALAGVEATLKQAIDDKRAAIEALAKENGLYDREAALLGTGQAIRAEQDALPELLAAAAQIQKTLDSWVPAYEEAL